MKRNAVRRLVFGLAIASFAGALLVLGIAFWALANLGGGHVGTASLFATAVFLGCCGVVFYLMSLGRRPVEPE